MTEATPGAAAGLELRSPPPSGQPPIIHRGLDTLLATLAAKGQLLLLAGIDEAALTWAARFLRSSFPQGTLPTTNQVCGTVQEVAPVVAHLPDEGFTMAVVARVDLPGTPIFAMEDGPISLVRLVTSAPGCNGVIVLLVPGTKATVAAMNDEDTRNAFIERCVDQTELLDEAYVLVKAPAPLAPGLSPRALRNRGPLSPMSPPPPSAQPAALAMPAAPVGGPPILPGVVPPSAAPRPPSVTRERSGEGLAISAGAPAALQPVMLSTPQRSSRSFNEQANLRIFGNIAVTVNSADSSFLVVRKCMTTDTVEMTLSLLVRNIPLRTSFVLARDGITEAGTGTTWKATGSDYMFQVPEDWQPHASSKLEVQCSAVHRRKAPCGEVSIAVYAGRGVLSEWGPIDLTLYPPSTTAPTEEVPGEAVERLAPVRVFHLTVALMPGDAMAAYSGI